MSDLTLEIHHLDVRGGDATAILVKDMLQDTDKGGKTLCRVLIDAGAEGKGSAALKFYLIGHLGGTAFDAIIATHYHQDHIQGFSQAGISFKKFLDNGGYQDGRGETFTPRNDIGAGSATTIFDAYKARVQQQRFEDPGKPGTKLAPQRFSIPFIEKNFDLKKAEPVTWELVPGGDFKLTCYGANGILANGTNVLGAQKAKKGRVVSPNDVSLALLLEWGAFTYLTMGDLSGDVDQASYYDIETQLVDYLADGPLKGKSLSVYKASHHGSEHSNQPHLFRRLKPDTTIVCCNMQKQVPSPIFLARLSDYFEDEPKATVVFTNTMKVFKNDDRYTPLQAIQAHIATNNVSFTDASGETFATNLGVKCAVIRRRVVDGHVLIDPDSPERTHPPIDRVSHEVLLRMREADDERELAATVKFRSYGQTCNWYHSYCDSDTVSGAFRDSQIPAILNWLAEDARQGQSLGRDYISEHFPALINVIDAVDPAPLDGRLLAVMNDWFNATFMLDRNVQPWIWKIRPVATNTLTSDQKKTIWMLLRDNSHQVTFNKAINWANGNKFNSAYAWNTLEREPYSGKEKRKTNTDIERRGKKPRTVDPS